MPKNQTLHYPSDRNDNARYENNSFLSKFKQKESEIYIAYKHNQLIKMNLTFCPRSGAKCKVCELASPYESASWRIHYLFLSHLRDSNSGPHLYERCALPTELRWPSFALNISELRTSKNFYFIHSRSSEAQIPFKTKRENYTQVCSSPLFFHDFSWKK